MKPPDDQQPQPRPDTGSSPAGGADACPALVRRGVIRTLVGMAVPMLAGTFAMNAYHLADTWFVSQLGTRELAAMSFTFPVVMLVTCVAGGLGTGLTMLVSHTIGRNDIPGAARLVTHGLMLMTAVTAVISTAGCLLITPVFRRLGADAAILPLVREYMSVWFAGALTMSLPMAGNGILISLGDSAAASRLMVLGTLVNLVLDPVMIFGRLGFPAMGIRGAALATVIAQAVSAGWLLALLVRRHRLLRFPPTILRGWPGSCRRIAAMGSPAILSMMLTPLSASVITRLLGSIGHEAVAAAGAAGRVEMFAFVIPMALGMSLTPYMSQNYGAGRIDRIRKALRAATVFALLYGGLMTVIFFVFASHLAGIFTSDPLVRGIFVAHVRIISFGFGALEVQRYGSFTLNGLHRPLSATAITAIRVLVLLIPLSLLGRALGGVQGIFRARLATDLLGGMLALTWAWIAIRQVAREMGGGAQPPQA